MKNLELLTVNQQREHAPVQEIPSSIAQPPVAPFMKQPKFRRLFDRHAGISIR